MTLDTVKVAVLCHNSNGAPEFFTVALSLTAEERNDGVHYEKALDAASDAGFDPVMCFDADDTARHQLTNLADWFNT